MSAPLFADDILFGQRFLACGGFYKGRLDGRYGPKTDAAWDQFHAATEALAVELGRFDPVSERNITQLMLPVQRMARRLLATAVKAKLPFTVRVTSGMRTYAQQSALYAQGRSRPGKIVTNAKAGGSLHNFGCAIDVSVFQGGKYVGTAAPYKALAAVVLSVLRKDQPVEFGGEWQSIKDYPHYQLTGPARGSAAKVRALFEAGTPFL